MLKLDDLIKSGSARPKSGVRGFVVAVIDKLEKAGKLNQINGKSVGTWVTFFRRVGDATGMRINTAGLRVNLLEWRLFKGTKESLYVDSEYYARNKEKYINQFKEMRPDVAERIEQLK